MVQCTYCGKEVNKPLKIGPGINFCDDRCYYKRCITQFPGSGLADMVARVRPDIAAEVGYIRKEPQKIIKDTYIQVSMF